jgi:hypothetical protein
MRHRTGQLAALALMVLLLTALDGRAQWYTLSGTDSPYTGRQAAGPPYTNPAVALQGTPTPYYNPDVDLQAAGPPYTTPDVGPQAAGPPYYIPNSGFQGASPPFFRTYSGIQVSGSPNFNPYDGNSFSGRRRQAVVFERGLYVPPGSTFNYFDPPSPASGLGMVYRVNPVTGQNGWFLERR